MASKKSGKGPNYGLIAGLGLVGGVAGGAVGHFALKVGSMESGGLAVLGLLVMAGVGLIPSSGGDTKRLATQAAVKKDVDSAYQNQSLGRLDQAEKLLLGALEKGQALGDDDLNNLAAVHSLGNLYRLQRKADKAEETYRKALSIYESLGMTGDLNYAYALRDCAFVLESRGQAGPSREMAEKALTLLQTMNRKDDVPEVLALVARNTRASGDFQSAITTYVKVKDLEIQRYGEHSAEVIETVLTTARCYRSLEKYSEALEHFKDALIRTNKADRPNRQHEAEALLEMAEVRLEQSGPPKDVEPLCLGSLKVLQAYAGPKEKMLQRIAAAVKSAREKLSQPVSETEFLWLFTQNRDKVRDLFREQPDLVTQKDRTGWGVLQWTLFLGWDDLMRWVIRNGAQKDGFEATVMSPIHVAAAWSKGSSITFMHEAEVALDVVGPQGWSPVHFAAYHGRQDCLEQLIARGCDAKRVDQSGRSALHLAAEQGQHDAVAYLLGKELDKDGQETRGGRTPLHLAAAAGHGAVVRTLLMNGANEAIPDKQGKTPIDMAEQAGNSGLVTAMKHFRTAMEG